MILPPPPTRLDITKGDILADQWSRWFSTLHFMIDKSLNASGSFTITANAATTVVTNVKVNADSVVTVQPKTASAATEIGDGGMYIVCANGSFTVTHANNATADRSFNYSVT